MKEPHQPTGGQPRRERLVEHLDRAWPGTGRGTSIKKPQIALGQIAALLTVTVRPEAAASGIGGSTPRRGAYGCPDR